jgi:cytoskeletal protein CcmA (bactofilin family)
MFDRDGLFNKKDDAQRKDSKATTTGPAPASSAGQRSSQSEAPRADGVVPAPKTTDKGSKLIVGPDIKLKGAEITDCDTLVVEGRVEASMDSRVIQIAEQGVFHGTAGIDVAEIRGRFEGELTVRKQLVIHSTGKVTGKVRYGKLSIEEGGELSGDIGALATADTLSRKERQPAPKPLAGLV